MCCEAEEKIFYHIFEWKGLSVCGGAEEGFGTPAHAHIHSLGVADNGYDTSGLVIRLTCSVSKHLHVQPHRFNHSSLNLDLCFSEIQVNYMYVQSFFCI